MLTGHAETVKSVALLRYIGTCAAFVVVIITSRGATEKGGSAMQDYTVLGCCASNFDCCFRISPPTRLLKKALRC